MSAIEKPSAEQQAVIDSWGRSLAVTAGAGCGKTSTLVNKCVALLEADPEARFAAVSFTERSASDLREKLSARLGSLSRHWVTTIHGLCGAILREFPREAGFDGEERVLDEAEAQLLWERAIAALWFEELPGGTTEALERLLDRESRDSLLALLARVRELEGFGVLESLRNREGQEGQEDARALSELGRYVMERYTRLKRRRGAIDFSDMEKGASRALSEARVRAVFHRRFDLVLVDEFQDTNPLQAGVVRALAREGGGNLVVVGDPKQSIYRFRDADVTVFERFCAELRERLSLTLNFRCRPGILAFTNQVCAPAFAASELAYEPLVETRGASPEWAPVVKLNVASPEGLCGWVQGQVAAGVPLHDMVLLMRKIRGGNEKWLKALMASGIPVAVGSGGFFWQDPRVRELAALLRWWDNPASTLSGAVFLRAPWVAVPDATLDAWIRSGEDLWARFAASEHPLARALGALRGQPIKPGELIVALLGAENGEAIERELGAQALGLWHRCEELSSRGLDFHAVALELAQAMDEVRRERDVPPPRGQGQLTVLTLHGAKGLEFPQVILVDLPGTPPRAAAPLLYWDRERGAFLGVRDEEGERDRKHPAEAVWREDEKRKSLAESKRLFYVALTRARERLVLVFPETERELDREEAYSEDNWRAWIEASGAKVEEVEATAEVRRLGSAPRSGPVSRPDGARPRSEPRPGAAGLVRARHSVTEWNTLARCPRLHEWKHLRPRLPREDRALRELLGSGSGSADGELTQRELGTRVHACLECGDFEALGALEVEAAHLGFRAAPLRRWAGGSRWMAPSDPARGREVWTELGFEVPIEGEILVGSIDRLVAEAGRYTIIDFKVTREEKTEAVLVESYRTQLALYGYALQGLEPRAGGATDAVLIAIAPGSVREVAVALDPRALEDLVPSLARKAVEGIARGGGPRPGPACGYCEFRAACPEGALKT